MTKKVILFLAFLMLSFPVLAVENPLNQFNRSSFKIGTWRGSSFVESAKEKLPKATLVYYKDSNDDLIEALRSNKIDAFITDRTTGLSLIQLNSDLVLFDSPVDKAYYAMGFHKENIALRNEISDEIERLKQNGFLKQLQDNWFSKDDSLKQSTPAPYGVRGVLRVGTSAVDPPFSFYKNNKLVGIEIELMNQVARNLGYSVEWSVVNHSSFIQALQDKKIDIDAALVTITPERQKKILFATPDYEDTVVLVLKK